MSTLRAALKDYLDTRRALGFELRTQSVNLHKFVAFLEHEGASHITTDLALRSPAISVSRSQAGDQPPANVAASCAMAGSTVGRSRPLSLPGRLANHRSLRAASALRRGSSGDQSNAASY